MFGHAHCSPAQRSNHLFLPGIAPGSSPSGFCHLTRPHLVVSSVTPTLGSGSAQANTLTTPSNSNHALPSATPFLAEFPLMLTSIVGPQP